MTNQKSHVQIGLVDLDGIIRGKFISQEKFKSSVKKKAHIAQYCLDGICGTNYTITTTQIGIQGFLMMPYVLCLIRNEEFQKKATVFT